MGCFNSTGFISRLPIRGGDRIVCFIGCQSKNPNGRELYFPDDLVSMFFLPFYGTYNDYGSIKDVDRTKIVELIEKYSLGLSIENVCDIIERVLFGNDIRENLEYFKENKEESKKYKSLLPLFFNDQEEKPVLLFEHEEIYNNLTKTDWGEKSFYTQIIGVNRVEKYLSFIDQFHKLWEKLEDEKEKRTFKIPEVYGLYSMFYSGDNEKYKKLCKEVEKYQLSSLFISHTSDSFRFFDHLTIEEAFMVLIECRDEFKKYCNLWNLYTIAPMYFGFSKTAGEQNYDMNCLIEMYEIVLEKARKIKNESEE